MRPARAAPSGITQNPRSAAWRLPRPTTAAHPWLSAMSRTCGPVKRAVRSQLGQPGRRRTYRGTDEEVGRVLSFGAGSTHAGARNPPAQVLALVSTRTVPAILGVRSLAAELSPMDGVTPPLEDCQAKEIISRQPHPERAGGGAGCGQQRARSLHRSPVETVSVRKPKLRHLRTRAPRALFAPGSARRHAGAGDLLINGDIPNIPRRVRLRPNQGEKHPFPHFPTALPTVAPHGAPGTAGRELVSPRVS